jgi:hypothetical protein
MSVLKGSGGGGHGQKSMVVTCKQFRILCAPVRQKLCNWLDLCLYLLWFAAGCLSLPTLQGKAQDATQMKLLPKLSLAKTGELRLVASAAQLELQVNCNDICLYFHTFYVLVFHCHYCPCIDQQSALFL